MSELSHRELIDMMFGDTQVQSRPDDLMVSDEVVLKVNNLTRKEYLRTCPLSFIRARFSELPECSAREERNFSNPFSEPISLTRAPWNSAARSSINTIPASKDEITWYGAHPEDRKTEGLVLMSSINRNLVYASLDSLRNSDL